MTLGSAEVRLRISAVLAVGIAVLIVQNSDDPVYDIEGEFGQPLELLPRDRFGGRQARAVREGYDLAQMGLG